MASLAPLFIPLAGVFLALISSLRALLSSLLIGPTAGSCNSQFPMLLKMLLLPAFGPDVG